MNMLHVVCRRKEEAQACGPLFHHRIDDRHDIHLSLKETRSKLACQKRAAEHERHDGIAFGSTGVEPLFLCIANKLVAHLLQLLHAFGLGQHEMNGSIRCSGENRRHADAVDKARRREL